MTQKITLILLLLAVVSCKNAEAPEKDKIKTADWLIGKWENVSPQGTLTETWSKVNDSTFQGSSYFIKGKDTIHFESIKLQQKGEDLTYNATVKGQNNDQAVAFELTTSTEKGLVFENPKHDYPQKISYTKDANNTLTAEISGKLQGKLSSEKFVMVKK
ncbi:MULTISPECIES: DUF6265 family protein [unclassified Flavobacterium]|uniref:DUF6265 family protein n=1 Tax=unclassified Flavobacterium TaxID=196869 RepID=UPI00057FC6C4|nr:MULTISPECIES: DUF6265 family protein [unclassified Flavobacterium]KIC00131.1 hypothetical protein OA93_00510 [Flavobacterium sp. KMS]MEA9411890.1 DUF6265 family protein [Flavobacterium sp. PL02]